MWSGNLRSNLFKAIGSLSVAGMVLAGVITAPASTALAQPATPPAGQSRLAKARDERLERWYQREQAWLSLQQVHLNTMNEVANKVQQFITTQQSKGKDVSALQAALDTFKSQIASAQSAHNTAASVLSAHQGFGADGQVVDADQARQTLIDARQSLRDAHRIMLQAAHDLRTAFREWREANGIKSQTQATPQS